MNPFCSTYPNHKQNYSNISCCIANIIFHYHRSENNLLTSKFGLFLLRSLNHHLKSPPILSPTTPLTQIKTVLQIIGKYSAMYYNKNKDDYAKLLIKCGIQIINESPYKEGEELIKEKEAIVNNIACVYLKEGQADKSAVFLDKCVNMNKDAMNKAIMYNNYALVELARKKHKNGVHYFHLMYKEIKKYLKQASSSSSSSPSNPLNFNEKETIAFMLCNCCYAYKKYSYDDYTEHYDKCYSFCKKNIGVDHYITINLSKIEYLHSFDSLSLHDEQDIPLKDAEIEKEFPLNILTNPNITNIISSPANSQTPYDETRRDSRKEMFSITKTKKNHSVFIKNADNQDGRHSIVSAKDMSVSTASPCLQPQTLPRLSADVKAMTSNNTPKANNIVSKENEKEKPITKLPFQKKKKGLKDMFKLVLEANNAKKNKDKTENNKTANLFSLLAKGIKQVEDSNNNNAGNQSLNKIFEKRSPVIQQQPPHTNEYDQIMNQALVNNNQNTNIFSTTIKDISASLINQNIFPIQTMKHRSNSAFKIGYSPKNCTSNVQTPVSHKNKRDSKSSIESVFAQRHTTHLFKQLLSSNANELKMFPVAYVENASDFKVVDDMNNFFKVKTKHETTFNEELTRIITNTKQSNKPISLSLPIIDPISTTEYTLNISDSPSESKILLSLNNTSFTLSIDYDDLYTLLESITYYNTLPIYAGIEFIRDIPTLISNLLMHHIQIIHNNDTLNLGVSRYQCGINTYSYELIYLNTKCTCVITIANSNTLLMVLYNKANDVEYIRYDISIDDSSSKLLLSSKDIQKHIKHYTFNKDYDYKSFFSDMFIKLQEIHKHQHKRQSTTSTTVTFNLSEFIKDSKNSVYKLYLERRLNKKELWLISSPSHITKGSECYWKVEFFSLDKVEISNAAYFINKSINLDYMDFTHVIGVDPHDVSELLSTSDTIKINYILLHTVRLRNIMTKILTEQNYDSMLRPIKLKASCFFKLIYVIIHIKRHFYVCFEFVVYSKETFFMRLMLTESITCRSYAKVYLPLDMLCAQSNTINETKKELEKKYGLDKKLLSNKKGLKQVIVEEAEQILTKNPSLVLFEHIDVIVNKLHAINNNEGNAS